VQGATVTTDDAPEGAITTGRSRGWVGGGPGDGDDTTTHRAVGTRRTSVTPACDEQRTACYTEATPEQPEGGESKESDAPILDMETEETSTAVDDAVTIGTTANDADQAMTEAANIEPTLPTEESKETETLPAR